MQAFATTNIGIESIAVTEIKELTSAANLTTTPGLVLFDLKKLEDLCTLAYRAQSLARLCVLVGEFSATKSISATITNFKQILQKFPLNDWLHDSFVVECHREGQHDFTSHDFALAANKLIADISGKNIDFKTPQLRFFCYINNNKGYFGVDIAGFDLSKREFRLFGHQSDLKATVAYALVRLSGYKAGVLLDPFARSGAIAIEAALFASNFPVNYYRKDSFDFLKLKPFSNFDFGNKIKKAKLQIYNYSVSMPHIKNSEKNAKIAGINKLINFSRVELNLLERKFDKHSVDYIVSAPPLLSKNSDEHNLRKLYSEFFYQAEYILSQKGRIVLASDTFILEEAAKHNFKLIQELEFQMGDDKRKVLIFSRS